MTATTQTSAGVAYRLGLVGEIPLGEGRAFALGGEQVAVFRLRDGSPPRRVGGLPAPGRTRSPTARSTTASCSARCT